MLSPVCGGPHNPACPLKKVGKLMAGPECIRRRRIRPEADRAAKVAMYCQSASSPWPAPVIPRSRSTSHTAFEHFHLCFEVTVLRLDIHVGDSLLAAVYGQRSIIGHSPVILQDHVEFGGF